MFETTYVGSRHGVRSPSQLPSPEVRIWSVTRGLKTQMTLQILDFSLYTFLLSILVICVVTCYYMIEYGLEAFAPTDFILLYLYYPFILFVACGTFVVIFSFNRLVPQGQDFFRLETMSTS
jgi:hypothetical protein